MAIRASRLAAAKGDARNELVGERQVGASLLDEEFRRRYEMWQGLQVLDNGQGFAPADLRRLRICGGQHGMWTDNGRTSALTAEGQGVTVSLMATGRYEDPVEENRLTYDYPRPNPFPNHDANPVAATKAAQMLSLPVFYVTASPRGRGRKDVRLVWVSVSDDSARRFTLESERTEGPGIFDSLASERPLASGVPPARKVRTVQDRPGQQEFKSKVLFLYGCRCAVCSVDIPAVIDAAHIRPYVECWIDDPRNGLPLCANHHRAFDAQLFCIEPHSLKVIFRKKGPGAIELRVTKMNLLDLAHRPDEQMLLCRYNSWKRMR